jgi:hypothetical protein
MNIVPLNKQFNVVCLPLIFDLHCFDEGHHTTDVKRIQDVKKCHSFIKLYAVVTQAYITSIFQQQEKPTDEFISLHLSG